MIYRFSQGKREALDNIHSLLQQNIKSSNPNRQRQRRRTVKNHNRSNQQKGNFARAVHFFVHFFAVVLHDFNVKLPETSQLHVFGRKCCTCSRSLFFHCRPFSPCISGHRPFLILSPPLQNFHVVLPTTKIYPLFFISRSRSLLPFFSLSFAGLPPNFSFSLSFSCSIFQICGHDN